MVKFLNKWLDLFGTWNEWKKGSKNLLHPREKEMNSFFSSGTQIHWIGPVSCDFTTISHTKLWYTGFLLSLCQLTLIHCLLLSHLASGQQIFKCDWLKDIDKVTKLMQTFYTHDDDETLKVKYAAKTIQLAIELDTQILLDWEREKKKHAAHFNLKFCRYKCYRIHNLRKSSIKFSGGERHENNSNKVERFYLAFACEKKQPIWNMDFNRKQIRCCFEIIFRNEKSYFCSMNETILGSPFPITSGIVPISINFIGK